MTEKTTTLIERPRPGTAGKCLAGHYADNSPVICSRPLVCYGSKGIGQPPCKHLDKCLAHFGFQKKGRGILRPLGSVG